MADIGSGVATGLIAGILVVAIGVAILFAAGGLNFGGEKDVNVDIEMPKAPELPKSAAPGKE